MTLSFEEFRELLALYMAVSTEYPDGGIPVSDDPEDLTDYDPAEARDAGYRDREAETTRALFKLVS